jgi:hypothetical protein
VNIPALHIGGNFLQPTLDGLAAGAAGQDVLDEAAAAHVVLDGTRHATRLDLLLSTIVEVLARGSQETAALVDAVGAAWPTAEITREDVLAALAVAQAGDQPAVSAAVLGGASVGAGSWRITNAARSSLPS